MEYPLFPQIAHRRPALSHPTATAVLYITAIGRTRPMPRAIIMRRGQKLPPHTKAVDRRSRWGNPYIARRAGAGAEDVVRMFACHLLNSDLLLDQLPDLTGWDLGCWDLEWDGTGELPLTCHAPLLLRLANTPDLLENPEPYLSALCHRGGRQTGDSGVASRGLLSQGRPGHPAKVQL